MLKPYDGYRETNIPWLEEVPSHWECKRINTIFSENKEINSKLDNIDAFQFKFGELVAKKKYEINEELAKTYSKYTLIQPQDIMINGLNLNYDFLTQRVALVKENGIITSAYISLRPRANTNSKYYTFLLKSLDSRKIFNGMGSGIRLTLDFSELKKLNVPIPPRDEQDQIVKYLDWQTSKINTLIKAKKKQIELLKEQKQAVINKAVTKGLNDTVPMKDSGIEWLGEVPEHWGITKAGKVYDIELGKMLQPNRQKETDTFESYVCALNVYWDRIDVHNLKQMWFSSIEREKYKLLKGDLIVVEGGDVATSYIWNHDISCYMQNAVHRVRPKKYSLNKYLYYWLFALKHMGYFEQICSKATFAHFTKEKFVSLLQLLPPLDEQQAIVTYLEEKTALIDKAIAVIEKEIELVSEYKTSLISSVVTGKVDVRNAVVPEFEVVEEEISRDEELEVDMDDSN